jgi:Tol biopolymer transport system component/DNA-binding winged helix-turn-helix (wHTH) protein
VPSSAQPSPVIRFGAFELDAANGELRKAGVSLKIYPQPFRVLLLLAERPGQIVTRKEIQRYLWDENTFVDFERGINFCMNQIRATLGDDAEKPRFIETVPRKGYRFIASLSCQLRAEPDVNGVPATIPVSPWLDHANFGPSARRAPGMRVVSQRTGEIPFNTFRRKALLALVLASVAAAGFAMRRWMTHSHWPNLQNIQITKLTESGKVQSAAISSDGRYVAYMFQDGENSSLRLRQIGARGEAQVVVHDALLYPGLVFSTDGDYIYFLRAAGQNDLVRSLYAIPALGGPERKLVEDIDSAVSFSPDGQQFAYMRGRPRLDRVEIRIANADGSHDRLLVNLQGAWAGYCPGAAWSPDGRRLAVSAYMPHNKPNFVIKAISTADGVVTEFFSSAAPIGRPRWLPKSDMLVVPVEDGNEHAQLWTISFPEGEAHRLTNDLQNYHEIDMARDGRTLVATEQSVVTNVWTASSADLSTLRQVTYGQHAISDSFPLADGKLAFINRTDNGLWVLTLESGRSSLVADAHDANWFTTCDRFILFESERTSTHELRRMNQDGTDDKLLTVGTTWSPTCSPDGRFVYYAEALKPRWKVRRVPIEGGTPEDIVDNPGEAIPGNVTISPDGKLIAFPFDVNTPQPSLKIAIVPINGGRILKTLDVPSGITGPRWSPDGHSLQYLLDRDGATNLWELSFAGGKPTQLTTFSSGEIFDFNWSTDGKRLVLVRGEATSDVVLLSNLH